jgi:hypothetical protein
MNVLQVLALTSTGFVLFAIVWVMYVEERLEQRELAKTRERDRDRGEDAEPVEGVHRTDGGK